MTEKYAVYIPGSGFEEMHLRAGVEMVLHMLETYHKLDQWPADISSLGIYGVTPVDPGEAFSQAAIEARGAAGKRGGYMPLCLVEEVPGSRIERWPCTHCDGFNPDHCAVCEHCQGTGYIDEDGEPWAHGDAAFRVQYDFDATGILEDESGGLGFFDGCLNLLAILLVVGGALCLLWWGLIVTGSPDGVGQ